jgi:hypothetical protein
MFATARKVARKLVRNENLNDNGISNIDAEGRFTAPRFAQNAHTSQALPDEYTIEQLRDEFAVPGVEVRPFFFGLNERILTSNLAKTRNNSHFSELSLKSNQAITRAR